MSEDQIKVILDDHMGSDLKTANAARVSMHKRHEEFQEGDARLIKYLARGMESKDYEELLRTLAETTDKEVISELIWSFKRTAPHVAPFGHNFMSFYVAAPVFVVRQLVKHKFLRMSEVSRRYVDDKPEFYKPSSWRGRSNNKKQGSGGDVELTKPWLEAYTSRSEETYEEFLGDNVAPEMARMVLPQSLMTEFFWSGSLDAFADMVNLRDKEDAQHESRLVAKKVSKEASRLYPYSWEALVG